jgi:hypothetical protein
MPAFGPPLPNNGIIPPRAHDGDARTFPRNHRPPGLSLRRNRDELEKRFKLNMPRICQSQLALTPTIACPEPATPTMAFTSNYESLIKPNSGAPSANQYHAPPKPLQASFRMQQAVV